MEKLKLTEIKVGTRFRKEFPDMQELQESIKQYGLIEPIVIDEHNNLIAGERRLRAHINLGLEEIEIKRISNLTDIEKKEIELEENIQRKQFTWQEEVEAKKQLHELKQRIHGQAPDGNPHGKKTGWGLGDTARTLGQSAASVCIDVELAEALNVFPELREEKNKSSAFKKMKKLKEKLLNEELARRMKALGVAEHPEVILGDSLVELDKLEAESFDLILTDPPYGIDVEEAYTYGKMTQTNVNFVDNEFETLNLLDKIFEKCARVLKQNRHMFVFCAIDKFGTLRDLLLKHGFKVHHIPLIWNKGSGSYPSQHKTFVHSYEGLIHAWRGNRELDGSPCDILTYKRVPANLKIHPTEKPTEMLRELIKLTTQVGEKVLDPFAGSGATLEAAKETKRQCLGIELDETYYTRIVERLNS